MSDFDPPRGVVAQVVAMALAEDFGILGDITSLATIPRGALAGAAFVARGAGVVAGTASATEVFRQVDRSVVVTWFVTDGSTVVPGTVLGEVSGYTRSLLAGERVALNLLSHLSGVATLTRRYVDAIAATGAATRVRDTRKTLPGLRALQKAAVRAGGGANHRDSLSDAVLVKDNHLAVLGIAEAVAAARDRWPGRVVEVECDTLEQVAAAVDAGCDLVLLDNMAVAEVRTAIELLAGAIPVEVSGRVSLDDVGEYAAAGADYIAVGAITHSVPVFDIGLDLG